jgi:hypothetical protein
MKKPLNIPSGGVEDPFVGIDMSISFDLSDEQIPSTKNNPLSDFIDEQAVEKVSQDHGGGLPFALDKTQRFLTTLEVTNILDKYNLYGILAKHGPHSGALGDYFKLNYSNMGKVERRLLVEGLVEHMTAPLAHYRLLPNYSRTLPAPLVELTTDSERKGCRVISGYCPGANYFECLSPFPLRFAVKNDGTFSGIVPGMPSKLKNFRSDMTAYHSIKLETRERSETKFLLL